VVTLIKQDEDSRAAGAVDGLMEMRYGAAHAYGRKLRGTSETAERIDSAVLSDFHRAQITPSSVSVALVGDIDPRRAVDAAAASFGSWAAPALGAIEFPAVVAPTARRTRVIPMMNKSQADIAYGFVSITRADPAYAYWLMNHIMGQHLWRRLATVFASAKRRPTTSSARSTSLAPSAEHPRRREPGERVRAISPSTRSQGSCRRRSDRQELLESKQYLIGSLPRSLVHRDTFMQTA
jgi:predicted Zn-dependent peptidase